MTSFFFLPLEEAARGADKYIFCCLAIVAIAFENVRELNDNPGMYPKRSRCTMPEDIGMSTKN